MPVSVRAVYLGAALLVGGLVGAAAVFVVEQPGLALQPPAAEAPGNERVEIKAHCAVASGGTLETGALHIRCGIDEEQIATVVEKAVAGLGLEALVQQARRGEPSDLSRVTEAAERMRVDPDRLRALVAQLAAPGAPQRVELEVEPWVRSTRGSEVHAEVPLVRAAPPADLRRLVELSAECAAIGAAGVRTGDVDIRCLRKEEVSQLLDSLLAKARVGALVDDLRRAALPKEEAAQQLAAAMGLAPEAAESLLSALNLQHEGATSMLEEGLRHHLELAVGLMRIRATAGDLGRQRDAVANALGVGDFAAAERGIAAFVAVLETGLDLLRQDDRRPKPGQRRDTAASATTAVVLPDPAVPSVSSDLPEQHGLAAEAPPMRARTIAYADIEPDRDIARASAGGRLVAWSPSAEAGAARSASRLSEYSLIDPPRYLTHVHLRGSDASFTLAFANDGLVRIDGVGLLTDGIGDDLLDISVSVEGLEGPFRPVATGVVIPDGHNWSWVAVDLPPTEARFVRVRLQSAQPVTLSGILVRKIR